MFQCEETQYLLLDADMILNVDAFTEEFFDLHHPEQTSWQNNRNNHDLK